MINVEKNVNDPESVELVLGRRRVYGGKDLWNRYVLNWE